MRRSRAAELVVGVPAAAFLLEGLIAALIVLAICGVVAVIVR